MRQVRSRELITEQATEGKASKKTRERVTEDHIWIYPFDV